MNVKTKVLITVILCMATLSTEQLHAQSLRLMTYNVHNGVGLDRERDHRRIAEVISGESPDFVAIQEVDSATARSGKRYVLGEIASASSMHHVFAPAIVYDGGRYGIGLLSRKQPDNVTRLELPGREESRMLLIADFCDYAVACTHLSLTEADALASTDIIRREAARRYPKPMILMGDFNSHPSSAVIDSLKHDFRIVSNPSIPTFPADSTTECLDYIMISDCVPIQIKSNVVINECVASDHRPVVADIEIRQRR